jgi:hypothetical protein
VDSTASYPSDVAFTPSVKAVQTRKGSRRSYERLEERGSWQTQITPDLGRFIEAQTSIFLGNREQGRPALHPASRGPAWFSAGARRQDHRIRGLRRNRQYITQGNLADNPKAYLFLIDYARRQRIKLWGEARVVEGDAELTARLMPEGYKARAEQVILFTVAAWDANCPQHIPQRFEAADVAAALAERDRRIAVLEGEVERLRGTEAGKPGEADCP